MNFVRICKAFQTCGILLKRSSRLCCEHGTTFNVQIARNCSISARNNQISTPKDSNLDSVEDCSTESLVQFIKSNIKLQHGPRYDYVLHDLNNVLEYLLEFRDVKQSRLLTLFTKQPGLCQHYIEHWKKSMEVLHGNGLPLPEILNILERCPEILKRDPMKIDNVFICLREHGFHDNRLFLLISKAPELLTVDASSISSQIKSLMTLFTHKDILKLAINSPQVLLEDFEDVEDKVRYIVHIIGVEQIHIVSNNALSHSLAHIQLRHEVMLRTGLYRKPHPKKKIENPRLSDMLDTPTKKFTEGICKISMNEYIVFEKMLQREIEKEKKMEAASDSGSDSDSDSDSGNDESKLH